MTLNKDLKNTLIFDFDGVIANSSDAMLKAFEEIARRKKAPLITKEEFSQSSTKDILKRIKIRWYEVFYYIKIAKNELKKNKHLIKLDPNMGYVIESIDFNKHNLVILSSNSQSLISSFLELHLPGIKFTEIIGDVPVFKKSSFINKIIKKYDLGDKKGFFYIGDETRDIIAARKAGVESIAVLWGKDSEKILLKENPNFVARDGAELAKIIKSLPLLTQ